MKVKFKIQFNELEEMKEKFNRLTSLLNEANQLIEEIDSYKITDLVKVVKPESK